MNNWFDWAKRTTINIMQKKNWKDQSMEITNEPREQNMKIIFLVQLLQLLEL